MAPVNPQYRQPYRLPRTSWRLTKRIAPMREYRCEKSSTPITSAKHGRKSMKSSIEHGYREPNQRGVFCVEEFCGYSGLPISLRLRRPTA